jgi:hypothetical protein
MSLKFLDTVKSFLKNYYLVYILLLSIPILLVYGIALFSNISAVSFGDADFFFANAEAFRKTVTLYHQFPWWNPWVSGGIPLYADPQFGLVSLQTFLVLVFGSVVGWKMAIIGYVLIGFYGMRKLLISTFKTPEVTSVLIALTWSISLFWSFRASAGHFTFFALAFLPWVLFTYWNLGKAKLSWLWLGLMVALTINSAPHNTTIMILVVVSILAAAEILFNLLRKRLNTIAKLILLLSKAGVIALILSIYKLFFTYQYSSSQVYERTIDPEEFIGWKNTFEALFTNSIKTGLLPSGWGKQEALAGLGVGIFLSVLIVLTYLSLKTIKLKKKFVITEFFTLEKFSLILCIIIFFLLSLGNATTPSPYGIMRELPILENTRVAARWLIPLGFFILVFLGAFRLPKRLILVMNTILLLNLLPLALNSTENTAATYIFAPVSAQAREDRKPPLQTVRWEAPRRPGMTYDDNLYSAVRSNVGQLSTNLTPFFDTKNGSTGRCDELKNSSCAFVISNNAEIKEWSPNKFILTRTGIGLIKLNMNVDKSWRVNGHYIFGNIGKLDPNNEFILPDDNAGTYEVIYSPKLSMDWVVWKINNSF